MKLARSLAILASLSTLLLPATTSAAGGGIAVRTGTFPSAAAAKVLTSRATNLYGVSVTVTSATGRYGGKETCIGGTSPLSTRLAAACRKAGGSYVIGKITSAAGDGAEFSGGSAIVREAGILTSTLSSTGALSSTKALTGTAGVAGESVTYLQITPTAQVSMPTTAADAQKMVVSMFPKLASIQYIQVHSQPGSYGFIGRSAPAGMSSKGQALEGMTVLLIAFKNAGKITVGAAVATSGAAVSLR